MANTTFTGPVVALNGFIGGPNPNAQDTAQGGKTPWTVSTSNVVQNATTGETLSAAGNEGDEDGGDDFRSNIASPQLNKEGDEQAGNDYAELSSPQSIDSTASKSSRLQQFFQRTKQ